jgi:MFS family permease
MTTSFYRKYLIAPKLLNFFTFLYQYSFYSFRSNFLKEYFLMKEMKEVAFVFFFLAVGSFIGMSLWAYASDRTRQPKAVFSFVVLASLLSFFCMYFQEYILNHGYKITIVTFLMTLFSFFNFGMNPILSSTVLEMLSREGITDKAVYGRQVAFGSFSFVVVNLVLGFFKVTSSPFLILALTGFMLLGVVFLVFPNDISPVPQKLTAEKEIVEKTGSPPWYQLLTNVKFVMFLSVIFLTGCARSFMSTYLTIYYKELVKLEDVKSSMLLVSGISFEIIGFWFSTSISKIGPYRMLVLAQFLMVVRCWAYYLIPGHSNYFVAFLLVELLKGAAFGLTHLAGVKVARESAPEGLEATAQAFYEGCYSQLPSVISVPLGGPAIDGIGFNATFFITAVGISISFVTVTSIFAYSGNLSRPNKSTKI